MKNIPLLLIGLLLIVACTSAQPEPTSTPEPPTEPPPPTDTSTPTELPSTATATPSPSHTPTFTPTPEPQIVFLRGAKGCDREHEIIANSPIQLHYGVWGSYGKWYAEASWDLLDVTLTMNGEEVEGEKQPVAADLAVQCGLDVENSYWIFYFANIEGIPPGVHYLEVTYYANGVIEDGWGQNHGPGTMLTHSYTLYSATED